jgi:2-keto-4-pentenoate hydratase
MTDHSPAKAAAARLLEAAKSGITCEPVRDLLGTTDLPMAYGAQNIITSERLKGGARLIGRKIGLTSLAVQKQLGVDQPDFGMLFDDMEVMHDGIIPWAEMMQPKVEGEIAFVLKRDLPNPSITMAELISSIDYALASLEIVGSRIEGWNIRITDTIADNASASHFVLGHRPISLENIDLINCSMVMEKNGETVSKGTGADCMGSPLNATLWLARTMAQLGTPLQAGEIILSGALGPMSPVAPGDKVTARFDTLGEVSVQFGE